ncbi:HAD family hydrolase [Marinibactrum halimedae]|uniref:Haloacid dehalogenase n=1 Tax=Marinibactrum halimedae TaxID=1444977 RepID=A0AA37WLS0_9GAMM|nr:HAD family hydrolase [Marinibactrum halimedae]MCD9458766.1 HAD-IB family hydrolase [Marinibactrum halimedae]GLS25325.1 haloacid dehalogenase [Marinibactrum halimedae]
MSLAIFDLDNTLIGGDSDHSWGEFLVERNFVSPDIYKEANDRFYREYQNGTLDIHEYLGFALKPLSRIAPEELENLRVAFMKEKIHPLELPKARALIEKHRHNGDDLLIITATNDFITTPIAQWLNIPNLLATTAEINNGRYTGCVAGTPCFQEGKVTRLNEWLKAYEGNLEGSFFYSDSANDIPLLAKVENPVAVDPDERLSAHAEANQWPIISLR